MQNDFFGNKETLELINNRVNGLSQGYRQNIAIIGEERIGKTYFLQHWLTQYNNNYVVPVYIEVEPKGLKAFIQKFTGRLLYAFMLNSGIPLREDIGFLMDKANNYIPKTIALCRELLYESKNKKAQDNFAMMFKIAENIYEETGKRSCFILDEFHRIESFKIKDIYSQWRKCIMSHKNTLCILVSSNITLANKILDCDLNMLFGNFQKVVFEPFDTKTTQAFIRNKFKGIILEQRLIDFLTDLSSSKPFYLKVICDAYADYLAKNPGLKPNISSLTLSLEDAFIEKLGTLNKIFYDLLNQAQAQEKDTLSTDILITLSKGVNRVPEIGHKLHRTKDEISQGLNRLTAANITTKTADIYLVFDRLFGFWLRSIYASYEGTFAIGLDKQKEIFAKEMSSLYHNLSTAQEKAMSERLLELFNEFCDDDIQLKEKPLRLNTFKEVKLLSINGKNIKEGILGRARNSLWIAGLKEGLVNEDDVTEFITLCKKFKYNKQPKKILITLDEMDVNARLIAKKEKIITWDISCINSLLEIYGKPRIVR